MSHTSDILYDVSNTRANSEIRCCIANSQGLTARLPGSRVGEIPPHDYGLRSFAPQNAPQIASCAVVPRRLASSLVLVKVVYRRVTSSGEKGMNTFTRLRSRVRVPQRPRMVVCCATASFVDEAFWYLVTRMDIASMFRPEVDFGYYGSASTRGSVP